MALAVIRTVLGAGALAIGFGLALALACLAIGLLLRGALELSEILVRAASALTALARAAAR